MADYITALNGFCGVMSVFSSLRYCAQADLSNHRNLYLALGFIPLGLFFDFMDGKVARWRGKASLMGQELDSLADLVCLFCFSIPNSMDRPILFVLDITTAKSNSTPFQKKLNH